MLVVFYLIILLPVSIYFEVCVGKETEICLDLGIDVFEQPNYTAFKWLRPTELIFQMVLRQQLAFVETNDYTKQRVKKL